MPNLQLSPQDAADIASWILSVPGEWPVTVDVPAVESKEVKDAVDELVKLYVSKSGSFKKADGKSVAMSLSEVDDFVEGAQARREAALPGRADDLAAGLLRLPHDPGLRERQADRHRAQRLGNQESRPGSISGTSREYLTDQHRRRRRATRDGTDPFYQEKSCTRPGWASSIRSCTGRAATTI